LTSRRGSPAEVGDEGPAEAAWQDRKLCQFAEANERAGLKAQLSGCGPKVKKDFTNLEQGLANLKEEITEIFRIEDHGVQLAMRRRNADIKKMIAMQRIGGDA
jgi:hypothetical protein